MSASPAAVPQRARRIWPWVLGGGALCLLLAIVLLLSMTMARHLRGQTELQAALDAMRRKGEPTTVGELELYYEYPPTDKDATRLWLSGTEIFHQRGMRADFDGLPIVGDGDPEIPLPGEPWADLQRVETFLQKYAGSLASLHEASDFGGAARYPTQFSQGQSMQLAQIQAIRDASRLLSLEAHVRAHRRDAQGMVDSLIAMVRLGNSLENDPTVIGQLVRVAVVEMAIRQMIEALPQIPLTDDNLLELQGELRRTELNEALRRGLRGERVLGLVSIFAPTGFGSNSWDSWKSGVPLVRSSAAAMHLQYVNAQLGAAELPWPDALHVARQVERDFDEWSKDESFLSEIRNTMAAVGSFGTPPESILTGIGRTIARRDGADAAMAIERFRRQRGTLPARLDELVPEFLPAVPMDPFDGKALRFVVRENEYVIYNVGVDGVDNLGAGDASGKSDDPYIIPLLPIKD